MANWSWEWDELESEIRGMERQLEQEQAAFAQAQAQQQAQQAAQQALGSTSGTLTINNSGQGQAGGGITFNTGIDYGYNYHSFRTFQAPPRHPQQDAHDFSYGLQQLMPGMIKEMVLKEALFMQFVAMLGFDVEKQPEALKQLTYNIPYGSIILKNEKFQFDLDKYMEDAPVKL